MAARGEALQEWLTKSWESDFFQALQRRLPLIILSSLALVLASFSASVSSSAVAWATGGGVAFMLAFLSSFFVRILRTAGGQASMIATVYGLTCLGLWCLFTVAGEFASVYWPAGVALRIVRYSITLPLMIFFLISAGNRTLQLFSRRLRGLRSTGRTRSEWIVDGAILALGTGGSIIAIVSAVADVALGGGTVAYSDVLVWQSVAVVLLVSSVGLDVVASRRWADRDEQ